MSCVPTSTAGALRRLQPAAIVHAAHEHVHVLGPWESARAVHFGGGQLRQLPEPLLYHFRRLLDERAHRQAPHESAGRAVGTPQAVRGPTQRHRGGLPGACRRDQDPRPHIGRERELPGIRLPVLSQRDSIDGGGVHGESTGGSGPRAVRSYRMRIARPRPGQRRDGTTPCYRIAVDAIHHPVDPRIRKDRGVDCQILSVGPCFGRSCGLGTRHRCGGESRSRGRTARCAMLAESRPL